MKSPCEQPPPYLFGPYHIPQSDHTQITWTIRSQKLVIMKFSILSPPHAMTTHDSKPTPMLTMIKIQFDLILDIHIKEIQTDFIWNNIIP